MTSTTAGTLLSLNDRAARLVDRMVDGAERLGILVGRGRLGNREIDCGVRTPGSIEAGLWLARICLADLAEVSDAPSHPGIPVPRRILVRTNQPVLACLASQYAGWHFSGRAEEEAFSVLGSGPARALARREPIFDEITHRETTDCAVLVLEADHPPPGSVAADAAQACGVDPRKLTILTAPTRSTAGAVQVAARIVECAVQKARLLEFPLCRIAAAEGASPLCPSHTDNAVAMGRTNDAIIYGGAVHLTVDGPPHEARRLAEGLPSRGSPEWGKSFAAVFERAGRDFHAIDAHFFSPAEARVTCRETGETFCAGAIEPELLQRFLA